MKASISNYRQAPRKVRLVTNLVKGKPAHVAQALLNRLVKRGAHPVKKLLDSAIANSGVSANELVVKDITVNKGVIIKRWMPRAMGRAFPIHKHTSQVSIVLAKKDDIKKKSVPAKKVSAKKKTK